MNPPSYRRNESGRGTAPEAIQARTAPGTTIVRGGIPKVEEFLSKTAGLNPESIGRKGIADAAAKCMRQRAIEDVSDYLAVLESDPYEIERLIENVVVPETWFFRDRESYNFLAKYVANIKSGGLEERGLRVLSVPCSTGEEPYSIAITLLEAGLLPAGIRIDAIDISQRSIETAMQAVYQKGSFRSEKKDYQARYFTPVEKGFKLDPAVAGLVHFYKDNFIRPNVLSSQKPYRIIFCKNLLIYLTSEARKKVMANLDRLLAPNGVVLAGHSEVLSLSSHGYSPVKHSRSFAVMKREPGVSEIKVPKRPRLTVAGGNPLTSALALSRSNSLRGKGSEGEFPGKNAPGRDGGLSQKDEGQPSLKAIRALADRGSLDEALALCERFLNSQSRNKEAYCLMGLINLAMNAFGKAEVFFQKALYLDPLCYEALLHMSLLYEKKGDRGRAAIMRERIRRLQEEGVQAES